MTNLDDKKKRADALREEMLGVIERLGLESLAVAAMHEYDDVLNVVTPPEGSAGAALLRNGRDAFVAWVRDEGRWPTEAEAENDAATVWHRGSPPALRAQAYVDLGLYHSSHATTVGSAAIEDIDKVLDRVAEQLAFTLAGEYGPVV